MVPFYDYPYHSSIGTMNFKMYFLLFFLGTHLFLPMQAIGLDFDQEQMELTEWAPEIEYKPMHPLKEKALRILKKIFIPLMMFGINAKQQMYRFVEWTKIKVNKLFARMIVMRNRIVNSMQSHQST